MGPITLFAFYFILWWLTFFAVLPFGIRTQGEEGEVTLGTVNSAPAKLMFVRKLIATTIISALILGVFYWMIEIQGVTWDNVPFIPKVPHT